MLENVYFFLYINKENWFASSLLNGELFKTKINEKYVDCQSAVEGSVT